MPSADRSGKKVTNGNLSNLLMICGWNSQTGTLLSRAYLRERPSLRQRGKGRPQGVCMDLAYHMYEVAHWMLSPARAASDATHLLFKNPFNPLSHTPYGRTVAAACELFERTTRRYGKPAFGLDATIIDGQRVAVSERVVWERPFGRVVSFD